MSLKQLPEIVPSSYGGRWIAWTSDALRIVAVADSPEELQIQACASGQHDIIYEWVPPADQRLVGLAP